MREQFFGIGFSCADSDAIEAYLRRRAEPDKDARPLTFRYDGAVVQLSDMGYRAAGDFHRAVYLEIDSQNPTAIFNAFARELPELAILMERSKPRYPFSNLPEKHLGILATTPEPELVEAK